MKFTMKNYFAIVKDYLLELECNILSEDQSDEVFIIEKEEDGIQNMVVACAFPILILEQQLFKLVDASQETLRELLKKNRDIIHGAFCLDDDGSHVIFRDTLALENLDLNELEGSLNSLSLLLSEYSEQMIQFSK